MTVPQVESLRAILPPEADARVAVAMLQAAVWTAYINVPDAECAAAICVAEQVALITEAFTLTRRLRSV